MTITRALFLSLAAAIGLGAQDVGTIRGENAGDYNFQDSFETGYRFASVGGNDGKYRSDLNYGDGIRLFSSSLAIHSRDGMGKWFDELILTTSGLGNDPYESAALRIEKKKLYEYSFLWRSNDYYNPGLTVDAGQHLMDTMHRWQDHDLTLLPQYWVRAHLGFSEVSQNGAALSTVQLFDGAGDEFPVFANIRRATYDYRLGADIVRPTWSISVMRRWEDFKEDTSDSVAVLEPGNDPTDRTTLTSFQRAQPVHGTSNGWVVNMNATRKWFAANGHFTYAGGERGFVYDETAIGSARFTSALNQQILVSGTARRPVTSGDASVSVFPTDRLTISNNSAIRNSRIDGNGFFQQFDNATLGETLLNFQLLAIRTFSNSTEVQYRWSKRVSTYVGYGYATRTIRSIEQQAVPGFPDATSTNTASQVNHENTGSVGVNVILTHALRFHAEGEIARDDHPFFPTSDRNRHNINTELRYRTRHLQADAGYRQIYNNNSISISAYSSRSRNWFADASVNAWKKLSFDANYAKLHLDTIGGLAFFAGSPSPDLVTGVQDQYVSNVHSGSGAARVALTAKADLSLGYTITRDAGGGANNIALLQSVHEFPLRYETPSVKLSIKISPKLRWNAAYQYYRYREDVRLFNFDQNYRAHTGYTSLQWAF